MQSGAAGGWWVVIAHVVDLVCTPKKPGPVAGSDTYMPLKCRQLDRKTDRQPEKQGTCAISHHSVCQQQHFIS